MYDVYNIVMCSYHVGGVRYMLIFVSYVCYMHFIILAHNIHIFQFYFIYRAHLENKFLLMKLPGTIEWLKRKRPSVVGERMYDIFSYTYYIFTRCMIILIMIYVYI